jgi:hypothetical protein
MANNVRIVLKDQGMRKFKRDKDIATFLHKIGQSVARDAGDGVESTTSQGRDRVRENVRTTTAEAAISEATDRTLSRAATARRS